MTLLNEADKIYIGALEADRVYAGATLVWQKVTGFSPISISGLEVWLDASQLGLTDGAAVSTWTNLGSGSQPSVVGSPAMIFRTPTLNGLPVVRFSANQGRLRGRCSMIRDYTLIYVVRKWGAIGRAFSGAYPEGSNFLVGYHATGMDVMYDEGWNYSAAKTPTADWKLYGADGVSTPSYTVRLFINGVMDASKSGGGGLNTYYHLSGYGWTGAEETADFDVAEMVIYNRRLDDAERVQVEDYLRAKWGL